MVYETVIQMLARSGFAFKIHEHQPVTTIAEANQKVPHLTHNLIKTVVFRIKDADWVLAAASGSARIHYKKLGDALGVKRTTLRSIAPDQVESELGFEIGGVGPFPVRPDVYVIFDERLRHVGNVFCGSGRNTRTIEMDVADLIAVSGGAIHPILKDPA